MRAHVREPHLEPMGCADAVVILLLNATTRETSLVPGAAVQDQLIAGALDMITINRTINQNIDNTIGATTAKVSLAARTMRVWSTLKGVGAIVMALFSVAVAAVAAWFPDSMWVSISYGVANAIWLLILAVVAFRVDGNSVSQNKSTELMQEAAATLKKLNAKLEQAQPD